MASSTGQAAPSSPAVANDAPPPAITMDARLLAVACSGSLQDLESHLNGQAAASSSGTVGWSEMHPGDIEACRRESQLYTVTVGGDTLLHVVAAIHGDSVDSRNKANFVYEKAQSLLFEKNRRGDTPLHCAARAGNSEMVSHLVNLVNDQSSINNAKALLETQNELKETALHEAVRIGNNGMVNWLMRQDPQLARFPVKGTSPLYIAILLENKTIAETLYELSRRVLSYSGPNGQNALHAAVLRGKDLTEMLLNWNKSLTIQQDENGSTPLHLVASVLHYKTVRLLLLEKNSDALYQPDNDGSFPIHVAASAGAALAITDFIKKSPSCVGLRDARGRTFLHVAVDKKQIEIVRSACSNRSLSWILNMQDSNGNTALHLAVETGRLMMFCALFWNRQVHLNLTNEKGETPLDIAQCNIPKEGLYYSENSDDKIHRVLKEAGGKRGICRQDHIEENDIVQGRQDETHEMDKVKEGTQSLCVGSVLIATVTFGASFAMPGGYRADDHTNGGTPTLAERYAFDAFTLANALAFASSAMATISLMHSGSPMVHSRSRTMHIQIASFLMSVSVTNLAAAFALATYTMLAPVAHKTAIAVCVLSSLVMLYDTLELAIKNSILIPAHYRRKGICHVWTFPLAAFIFVRTVLVQLLPIVVTFWLTAVSTPVSKLNWLYNHRHH